MTRAGPGGTAPAPDGAARCATAGTCPSAPAAPGAVLIGMVGTGGRVGYLAPPVPASAELLADLRDAGDVGRGFRFAAGCMQAGCAFWTGAACGLADRLVDEVPAPADDPLPQCGIRHDCRWWAQHGARACAVCPVVVTHAPAVTEP